jgi:hypothetical protein
VFSSVVTALDISAATSWDGEFESNFFLTVTNPIVGTPSMGRYNSGVATTHYGQQTLSNDVANGIGSTISGVIWSVLTGGATNIGNVIKGHASQSADLQQWRDSANNVMLSVGYTGLIEFLEQLDPNNASSNKVRLFARDNGAGKTQLCAIFQTGAVQVIATEP